MESRNEALYGWGGRTGTTGLQVDIFRSQFYEPNSCISPYLEEGMATQSSILAWRIPWTEELGGLQSMGLQRRHN